ncbi:MAG: hypothetical protein L3K18_07695 [Thermoplasmata archaeon]|nr:hypothetical protein [Thermoplasmata archaeon]
MLAGGVFLIALAIYYLTRSSTVGLSWWADVGVLLTGLGCIAASAARRLWLR